MIRSKFIYALVFLLITNAFADIKAQPAATKTITYNLCYPSDNAPLNNALLTNLMSSLPKTNAQSCISFKATFSFKYRVTGVNYRTEIFCDEIEVGHNIVFQRFDLAQLLIPVQMQFDAKIDDQQKSFDHKLRSGIKVGEILTPNQPQTFELVINSVIIDNDLLTRVVEKQQHISAYYTADTQIQLAFEELSTINPDSLQYIDNYLEITRKKQAVATRIKEKELYAHLNLGEKDPLDVYKRTNQLEKKIFDTRNALTQQSNNLGEEYLRLGLESIQQNDTVVALEYFNKAIEVDPLLGGAFVEIAKVDFSRKIFPSVIRQIRFISAQTTHHSGNRTDMNTMIKFIENQILEEAEQQNQKEHFHEALTLLDSAEHICSSIQVVVCSDMINVVRSHSYRGMLNEYIINWFDIVSREQYGELPQIIEETFDFRKNNNTWLTTNELIYVNLRIIQDSLLVLAEKNRVAAPEKALEALFAAREICSTYTEIACPADLDAHFKAAFTQTYEKMLTQAEAALNDSLPNRADTIQRKAAQYCRAQNIDITNKHKTIIQQIEAQRYQLLIVQIRLVNVVDKHSVLLLDSLLVIRKRANIEQAKDENFHRTRLLTDYVAGLTEKADRMIKAEQFIIAVQLLNEIDWVVNRFGYVLSSEIEAFIVSLRSKVGSQACFDKNKKLQIYLLAAEIHLKRKDFLHAEQSFNKAKSLISKNSECGFDLENVKKQLAKIEQAAYYQRDVRKIKSLAVDNEFEKALEVYDALIMVVSDSILQRTELQLDKIGDLAIQLNYLPFIQYTAKVLAERGYPNQSFGLITILYDSEFNRELTEPAQKELGASLAKEFFIKNPSVESSQLYLGYILHKKWSKPFIKAYKKKWKEMQVTVE